MQRALVLAATTIVAGIAVAAAPKRSAEAPPAAAVEPLVLPAPAPAIDASYNPTQSFAPLIDGASAAVVALEVEGHASAEEMAWLRRFGVPEAQMPHRSGQGSGFIISADGLMLTNHHVVADADEVRVVLSSGEKGEATVLGSDRSMDIALLRLPSDRSWPHLTFADSDAVRVGDWVLAMGNPLGLGMTVTAGILSGKGRELGHDIFGNEDYLQTDAAINPGNSGGPLIDLHGRVVGMNTAIIAGANTVGFAIPAKLLQGVLDDLRDRGHVARGFLGVNSQPLTPELARALGVDAEKGAVVASIFPDTPAAEAGLLRGDVVVGIDGEPVDDQGGLVAAIGNRKPGETVQLEVVRGDKRRRVEVTLTERPGEDAPRARASTATVADLGLTLSPLSPEVAAEKGVGEGVLVESVDRDGPAAGRLRPGDIILQVNRHEVRAPEDVTRLLARASGTAFLVVSRGDAELFVTVPLP